MRVALISGVPLLDGSESGIAYYTRALADELAGSGMDVEIWSKLDRAPAAAARARILPLWRPGWLSWWHLARAVKQRRPDVVHLQHSIFLLGGGPAGEISMFMLLFVLAIMRCRLVVTCHDIPSLSQITPEYVRLNNYRYPAWFVRLGFQVLFAAIGLCAHVIIVHQQAFAQTLAHDYGIKRDKMTVVPLMPIPHRVTEKLQARAAIGIPPDDLVVLFFGFATGYKGIEVLLGAMELVNKKVRLLLGAGKHPKVAHTPEYRAYYDALKRRAERNPNVDFIGFIPEERLYGYIDATDVAVFPYVEFQGMSGPLIQCASHEKPFLISSRIAQKLGGFSGCVFEPEPEILARKIQRYFHDDDFRADVESECANFAQFVVDEASLQLALAVYSPN